MRTFTESFLETVYRFVGFWMERVNYAFSKFYKYYRKLINKHGEII